MIYDGMPYDPIQGQGYGGLKCTKIADFTVYLLRWYARNQKTNGELCSYDTPRQYLNFNRTGF